MPMQLDPKEVWVAITEAVKYSPRINCSLNMVSNNPLNVCLQVLQKENKGHYDFYSVKEVPSLENVKALKDFSLQLKLIL